MWLPRSTALLLKEQHLLPHCDAHMSASSSTPKPSPAHSIRSTTSSYPPAYCCIPNRPTRCGRTRTDRIVLKHAKRPVRSRTRKGLVVACQGHGDEADGYGAGFCCADALNISLLASRDAWVFGVGGLERESGRRGLGDWARRILSRGRGGEIPFFAIAVDAGDSEGCAVGEALLLEVMVLAGVADREKHITCSALPGVET